jgi:hypothetical protein
MNEERKLTPLQNIKYLIEKIRQEFSTEQKGVGTKQRVLNLNSKANQDDENGIEFNKEYGCKSYDLALATHIYHSWLTLPRRSNILLRDFIYKYGNNFDLNQHKTTR